VALLKIDLLQMKIIKLWHFNTREEALNEEQRILREYEPYRNNKKNILFRKGGDTEIFTKDVLGLDTSKKSKISSFLAKVSSKMEHPRSVFIIILFIFLGTTLLFYSWLENIFFSILLGLIFSLIITIVKHRNGTIIPISNIIFNIDKVSNIDISLQAAKCRTMQYEYLQKRKKLETKIKKFDDDFQKKYDIELDKYDKLKFNQKEIHN
jgi:hypothetical protein